MIRIVLTDEQMEAIAGTSEPIDLVDSTGRMLGRVTPLPPAADDVPALSTEELADIKRRMAKAKAGKGNFSTWKEIKTRLEAQEKA
ncbi:MAG: hypothetical protein MI725_17275 [Pirellulales bacterium]|nr:hypothetical protein [Pirellulales bacterium]